MPINVFGNFSNNSENRIDTSLFVQKRYLRTNYIENNNEEDIDLKNQFRIKNLPDLISIREAASKTYVDNLFNNPSIVRNNAHIDFTDRIFTNARFIQVNQLPQIHSHLTAKLNVDQAISNGVDKSSLLRIDSDEKLKKDFITLNSTLTSPKIRNELPTKKYVVKKFNDPSIIKNTDHIDFNDKNLDNVSSFKVNTYPFLEEHLKPKVYVDNTISDIITYIDKLHEVNRNRRDLSSVFNDQDNEFDNKNKLTNLDSIRVNRNPSSDNELSIKKFVDDSIREGRLLRFNQTL